MQLETRTARIRSRSAGWSSLAVATLVVCSLPVAADRGKRPVEPAGESCREVVVSNSIAYVGQSPGLVILDVAEPAAPEELGRLALPGSTFGVSVQDGIVLVAAGSRGMFIVDASDPAAPNLIQLYQTPGAVRQIARNGAHAYLAVGSEGLKIVDVSRPERPQTAGVVRTRGELRAMVVEGDRLATAEDGAGVRLFDVRNPADPREVAWFSTARGARDVAFHDDLILVAAGSAGLLVYHAGEGARSEPLGVHAPEGLSAVGVATFGSLAVVAAGNNGLRIIDLSNPANPTGVGALQVHRSVATLDVAIAGESAFIAAGVLGMAVVSIADATNPELLWPQRREFKISFPPAGRRP